jgi:hypothetical protein
VAAVGSDVVVTWAAKSADSTNVYAAFSRDGGASFGAPMRVNDVEGDARWGSRLTAALGTGVDVVRCRGRPERPLFGPPGRVGERTFAPAGGPCRELRWRLGWASLAVDRDAVRGPAGWAERGVGGKSPRQDLFRPSGAGRNARRGEDRGGRLLCQEDRGGDGPDGNVMSPAPSAPNSATWRSRDRPRRPDVRGACAASAGHRRSTAVPTTDPRWPWMPAASRTSSGPRWSGSAAGKGIIFYSYRPTAGARSRRASAWTTGSGAAHPQIAVAASRVRRLGWGGVQRRIYKGRSQPSWPRVEPRGPARPGAGRPALPAVAASATATP